MSFVSIGSIGTCDVCGFTLRVENAKRAPEPSFVGWTTWTGSGWGKPLQKVTCPTCSVRVSQAFDPKPKRYRPDLVPEEGGSLRSVDVVMVEDDDGDWIRFLGLNEEEVHR